MDKLEKSLERTVVSTIGLPTSFSRALGEVPTVLIGGSLEMMTSLY